MPDNQKKQRSVNAESAINLLIVERGTFCTCPAELREQHETAIADLRANLKIRVEKINELMESAAHTAADLEEMKHELEAVSSQPLGHLLAPAEMHIH